MIQEFLIVKKDIIFNGVMLLKKGAYFKEDVVSNLTFLNYDDKAYFATETREIFDPGTKVRYNDEKYYIIKLVRPGNVDMYGKTVFRPISLKENLIDIRYDISKSMTDKPKEHQAVQAQYLLPMDRYWFITSKGEIHETFVGDDQKADSWRVKTGNYFKTKEAAKNEYYKLLSEIG